MHDDQQVRRSVPVCLWQKDQWVCWKYVERGGKATKVPISPASGGYADSTDPGTWASLDDALAACKRFSALEGVGFVFTAEDEFCGIDLDDCIDADGQMKAWGRRIIDEMNSYAEISPSGCGVKIFVQARKPGDRCKTGFEDGEVEMYDQRRFFTVTGQRVEDVDPGVHDRQEQVDALYAEVFGDTLDRLWKVIRMGAFNIGAALVPTLQMVAEKIMRVAMVVSAWIKQNQQIIVTVLKVAAVVVAVGIALTVLGTIISSLGTMLGVLITVVTTVVAVLKVLAAVIAFLISPIGLVIAAVAALGAYLVYATDIGAKALAWLGDRFNVLKEDALSAYQGIADALAAGDISLAVKILWLTLKMEWQRGINFLEKAWLNFRDFFIKIGYDAWHGLLAVAEIVWHALEVGWIETTAFFSKLWTDFTSFFSKTWENIKAGAQKAWNWIKSLFDDSVDLEAENKMVEEQKQAAIARIEDEQKRKTAQREAQREAERRRASVVHEATLGEIGRQNLEKHRELDTEYANRMSENEADLAKARQEWREAIETAKRKRQEKESAAPEGLEGPDDIINKARDALAGLGDIGDLVQQEAAKIGVRGTFNAAAVQSLAAGDAADRTAKATEETAKNTKKLVQAATTGGLTFA